MVENHDVVAGVVRVWRLGLHKRQTRSAHAAPGLMRRQRSIPNGSKAPFLGDVEGLGSSTGGRGRQNFLGTELDADKIRIIHDPLRRAWQPNRARSMPLHTLNPATLIYATEHFGTPTTALRTASSDHPALLALRHFLRRREQHNASTAAPTPGGTDLYVGTLATES